MRTVLNNMLGALNRYSSSGKRKIEKVDIRVQTYLKNSSLESM